MDFPGPYRQKIRCENYILIMLLLINGGGEERKRKDAAIRNYFLL